MPGSRPSAQPRMVVIELKRAVPRHQAPRSRSFAIANRTSRQWTTRESIMPRQAMYGVQFVGYSANVIARKCGREVDYASLEFLSGSVSVMGNGGWVTVSKRIDLGPFVRSLPTLTSELQDLLHQRDGELVQESAGVPALAIGKGKIISLSSGPNSVSVAPGTEIKRFIRQVTKRFTEVEQVLEQAEAIGLGINRRPYSEYIDEMAKTGLARVEGHGFGLFVDGKLIFYPKHQVVLVRQVSEETFEVHPLDETSKIGSHFIN
jgi:hypothetical protein